MPLPLRADFDAQMVRFGRQTLEDGPQARRLLALAAIYEGASRTEAGQDRRRDASDHSATGCSSSTLTGRTAWSIESRLGRLPD